MSPSNRKTNPTETNLSNGLAVTSGIIHHIARLIVFVNRVRGHDKRTRNHPLLFRSETLTPRRKLPQSSNKADMPRNPRGNEVAPRCSHNLARTIFKHCKLCRQKLFGDFHRDTSAKNVGDKLWKNLILMQPVPDLRDGLLAHKSRENFLPREPLSEKRSSGRASIQKSIFQAVLIANKEV